MAHVRRANTLEMIAACVRSYLSTLVLPADHFKQSLANADTTFTWLGSSSQKIGTALIWSSIALWSG
jgi:hypothetical protein